MTSERYSFGPFLLEVEAFRLSRDGQVVPLQPKMLELLIRLVRSAGELVPREVLQAEMWPDVVVTEQSLRQVVYRLRELLGQDHQHLVETVPRRGFRFVGVLEQAPAERPAPAYEILGKLGGGGAAEVFAVRHRVLQRDYALKVLTTRSPGLVERLAREARAQARVQHENVLPVLDVVEHEGSPALLLPLVEGPTLQVLLEQQPQQSDLIALFVGVVRGVAAIHEAGLVHRDLKPHNVLLEPAGPRVVPKVADFGLVKGVSGVALTQAEIALGTPGWMAPEQRADAATVDARADVWALGRLLLEMLGTRAPAGWSALAERCQSPDPLARPADASELLRALGELPELSTSPELVVLCRTLAVRPRAQASPAPSTPTPGALPAERDTFIGRADDLRALSEQSARLISVTGPGGVGKTRLALHHARLWRARWPGGAYFCDLSEVRDVDGIAHAVAHVLEVPLGEQPISQLGHAIASRGRCLLLLDNCEQVAEVVAEVVGAWMDLAEQAQFMATTQQILGIPGEVVFSVPPLREDDARELFIKKAMSVKRGFQPTLEDIQAIDELTKMLDGLPLALELAAARVSVLSPARILERMGDRFRVLSAGGARKGRQATLRAALDWSWELLAPDERAALAQLSVFSGGFTLAAAEDVLQLQQAWPVDMVQGLVHKSLVVVAPGERFTLLGSTQAYAGEQLSTPEAQAVEQRHGRYYLAWGAEILEMMQAPRGDEHYEMLVSDLDNLLAACRRAIARGDARVAAGTACAAWQVFLRRGPLLPAVDYLEGALTTQVSPLEAHELHAALGWLYHRVGRVEEAEQALQSALVAARQAGSLRAEGEALRLLGSCRRERGQLAQAHEELAQALVLLERAGHPRAHAVTLVHLGALHAFQGRTDEAFDHQQRALQRLRELGDRRNEGLVLFYLGDLYSRRGQMQQARACAERALQIDRELGDRVAESHSWTSLAGLAVEQGQMEEALACYEEALRLDREMGNKRRAGVNLGNIGATLATLGRLEEARVAGEQALHIHREVGNRSNEGVTLAALGELLQGEGRLEEALAHYEQALHIHRELAHRDFEGGVLVSLCSLLRQQGELAQARQRLDEGEAIMRAAVNLPFLAALLCERVELEHACGDMTAARKVFDEVSALAADMESGPSSLIGAHIHKVRAILGIS